MAHRRHLLNLLTVGCLYNEYRSSEVSYPEVGKVYEMLVEIWPTAVVVEAGGKIVFEVASGDTQGGGITLHVDPVDR